MSTWQRGQLRRDTRLEAGSALAQGKIVKAEDTTRLLEAMLEPGDRVCLKGDNQKQADLLSTARLGVDPARVNSLHMVQSGVVLPSHLDIFERGIAKRLDYAYSGPLHRGGRQGLRFAQASALGFRNAGGIGCPLWRERVNAIHRDFVALRLTPGGSADLLARVLLVAECERSI